MGASQSTQVMYTTNQAFDPLYPCELPPEVLEPVIKQLQMQRNLAKAFKVMEVEAPANSNAAINLAVEQGIITAEQKAACKEVNKAGNGGKHYVINILKKSAKKLKKSIKF